MDLHPRAWYLDLPLPALLRHARTTYGQAMRRALEAGGFTDIPGNGLYVIGAIALNEAPVTAAQMARELRLDRERTRSLIGKLAVDGYVRVEDGDDRILQLTDRGERAAAVQMQARREVDAALEARVGTERVTHGRLMLAMLIEMEREAADV